MDAEDKNTTIVFHEFVPDFFSMKTEDNCDYGEENYQDGITIHLELSVNKEDADFILKEISTAFSNWMYDSCENSILLKNGITTDELLQIPVGDYILQWIEECQIKFIDVAKEKEISQENSRRVQKKR